MHMQTRSSWMDRGGCSKCCAGNAALEMLRWKRWVRLRSLMTADKYILLLALYSHVVGGRGATPLLVAQATQRYSTEQEWAKVLRSSQRCISSSIAKLIHSPCCYSGLVIQASADILNFKFLPTSVFLSKSARFAHHGRNMLLLSLTLLLMQSDAGNPGLVLIGSSDPSHPG